MSNKIFCNPLNIDYRYQFNQDPRAGGLVQIGREAADPSMIRFQGKYYIFASMQLSAWVSEDLAHWKSMPLPKELPLYDYAPDVRVIGEYVYFSASKREEVCDRWRTKDIENGPYEKLDGNFPFWDPNVFLDDDGRVYFYWGCTNTDPIWGCELDPVTMNPITEPKGLIYGDALKKGFERSGEDHSLPLATEEEIDQRVAYFAQQHGMTVDQLPQEMMGFIRGMFSGKPFIEGAWMDKHDGKYYLQYAFPGTEYNIYGDGVYVSDSPLGEFRLAENNPYSYKPGGFLPGAGHGSTMEDPAGNWWHTASMRISKNFNFERRVGIWPAGFDADGELFCNQRYGDWPVRVPEENNAENIWGNPEWMLLSYGKNACASSTAEGHDAAMIADENVQTWWRAATDSRDEWVLLDLGKTYDVRAVQINFADDKIDIPIPGKVQGTQQARYIDEHQYPTQWKLLGKADGDPQDPDGWFVIEDKSDAQTDLPHDLVVREDGLQLRYLKLTSLHVPYDQNPCISGLRVFGKSEGTAPAVPEYTAKRTTPMDMEVEIQESAAGAAGSSNADAAAQAGSASAAAGADAAGKVLGYNILFGSSPEKLYHSYMIFGRTKQRIGALVEGREYYVRVDAFNESGITEGICRKVQ